VVRVLPPDDAERQKRSEEKDVAACSGRHSSPETLCSGLHDSPFRVSLLGAGATSVKE
jgi:hypothetical protein